jgi:hypothetical protein
VVDRSGRQLQQTDPYDRFGSRAGYARLLVGILINNSRLTDLRAHMDTRFDEMRDLWRSGLDRVD